MTKGIDPQELANIIAALPAHTITTYAMHELKEKFNLPDPVIKQTMVITLELPVENMDPMGNTYAMGCDKIREILRTSGLTPRPQAERKLIARIEKVEIVPRKES